MNRSFDLIDIIFISLILTYLLVLFISLLWIILSKLEKRNKGNVKLNVVNRIKNNITKKKEIKPKTKEEASLIKQEETNEFELEELAPIVIDDRTMSMKLAVNNKSNNSKSKVSSSNQKASVKKKSSSKNNTNNKNNTTKKGSTKKKSATKKSNTKRSKGYVSPNKRKSTK